MTKQQSFTQQKINHKREARKRNRKKKLSILRNTGRYVEYYKQKRGLVVKRKTIRSSTGSGVPQAVAPKQKVLEPNKDKGLSSSIKKIFNRKK